MYSKDEKGSNEFLSNDIITLSNNIITLLNNIALLNDTFTLLNKHVDDLFCLRELLQTKTLRLLAVKVLSCTNTREDPAYNRYSASSCMS
jgi:hypothetical protein